MESSSASSISKKLWHIVRVVYYMLRKSISKQKLLMDLNLLFKRGKIASKNLSNIVTFNHQHANDITTAVSELNFSSTTKRKNRQGYHLNNAEAIAKVLEILKKSHIPEGESVAASPPLLPAWSFGKSPIWVQQLRATDVPFPVRDGAADSAIDKEAEAFIRRFYEQLNLQPTATPARLL